GHDLLGDRPLLVERRKRDETRETASITVDQLVDVASSATSPAATCREIVVRVVVVVQSQPELLEAVFALSAAGGFASLLDGRQEQRNEDRDDRDHDEQLN